jgi:uncharacterized membrane protein YdbT with pleckstrin-like domain
MRGDMAAAERVDIPGDIILEPNEQVLLATHPLYVWEIPVLLCSILAALAAYGYSIGNGFMSLLAASILAILALSTVLAWIPWRARWFILTDRRVIARWGVLNRNQAALLLDRIQDASLMRPFPLSLIRDYGVIHVESAGELSDEKISAGLRDLKMVGASRFYRALTDALTPGR